MAAFFPFWLSKMVPNLLIHGTSLCFNVAKEKQQHVLASLSWAIATFVS